MKIIQAMRRIRELTEKAEDLRKKVVANCVNLSTETPAYSDPKAKITEWIQSHHDTLKEILSLRVAIQRTNLATKVTIELGGKQVTKTIAEWIFRRRDLAKLEMNIWASLGDGNRKEGTVTLVPGAQPLEVKILRHWSPEQRDVAIDLFRSEPSIIDGHLEIINAVTDLIEKREPPVPDSTDDTRGVGTVPSTRS